MLQQKTTFFAWEYIKTQGPPDGIWNMEIRVVQKLCQFIPTFFLKIFKLWHQKIGFGTGHQDIGQKLYLALSLGLS